MASTSKNSNALFSFVAFEQVETIELELSSLRNELRSFMLNQVDENHVVREQIAHMFTLLASAKFQQPPPIPSHVNPDSPSRDVVEHAASRKRDEYEGVERRV